MKMSETSSPKRPRLDFEESRDDPVEKFPKNRDPDELGVSKTKRKREEIDEDETKEEEKSKPINMDTARREHTLVMRLTNKEQELQECMNQIQEMKQAQTQNTAQLRSMLLDPAINLVFQRMAKEMDDHKEKLKQKQNELSAWKFTPDSQTGMRLMTKCRMLLQENGELGKMISSGRTARLEGEIALQKSLVTEMKTNQKELDEFVGELEEDVEGMQGMIFMLQQQLKEARDQIARLQQENEQLRTLRMPPDPEPGGENHLYDDSGNNTPLHTWHQHGTDSDVETSTAKQTSSPGAPPSLSLSSTSLRNNSCRDPPSTESGEEEANGGFLVFKATPDSGMYTLEEDTSVDNTDTFTDKAQCMQQQQHTPDITEEKDSSSPRNVVSSTSGHLSKPSVANPSERFSNKGSNDKVQSSASRLNGSTSLTDTSKDQPGEPKRTSFSDTHIDRKPNRTGPIEANTNARTSESKQLDNGTNEVTSPDEDSVDSRTKALLVNGSSIESKS